MTSLYQVYVVQTRQLHGNRSLHHNGKLCGHGKHAGRTRSPYNKEANQTCMAWISFMR